MTELKPCPFCGCKDVQAASTAEHTWRITCTMCPAMMLLRSRQEVAFAIWNKRVGEWPTREEIADVLDPLLKNPPF